MTLLFEPFGPLYELESRLAQRAASASPQRSVAPVDVISDGDAITLTMDVPGLKADEIEIELDGNTLTVRGERRPPYTDEDGRAERLERPFGAFERTVRLPDGIDADRIEGTISHGVLTLRIPLSTAQAREGANRVDIRDQQRAPEAASPAS
jgi:HSP20 family protein